MLGFSEIYFGSGKRGKVPYEYSEWCEANCKYDACVLPIDTIIQALRGMYSSGV